MKSKPPTSELLNIPETSTVLHCSDTKARRLVWSGAIPSVRVGRSVFVLRSDVERILQACRKPADPKRALPGAMSALDLSSILDSPVGKGRRGLSKGATK